jgi:hypothetical protein
VLANGGTEGRPPTVVGDVVRYSFVLDPDATFIEPVRLADKGAALIVVRYQFDGSDGGLRPVIANNAK